MRAGGGEDKMPGVKQRTRIPTIISGQKPHCSFVRVCNNNTVGGDRGETPYKRSLVLEMEKSPQKNTKNRTQALESNW